MNVIVGVKPMFDLSNYETVESRISRFYDQFEGGKIITELVDKTENSFIVKAFIFRNFEDIHPSSTGYAEEKVGSSPVNRTSALENCETSAIGRGLANLNFAPKGARPSREEMQKANDYDPKNYKPVSRDNDITEKQVSFVKSILEDAFISSGMRDHEDRWSFVTKWLGAPRKIAGPQHLTKMEAIKIINDKTSNKGELIKSLRSHHGPNYDPWETPAETKESV